MKNKNILIGTALTGVLMCGGSLQAAAPVAKGNPSPWVTSIVNEITKFGQSEACADGRALRKQHTNCANRDGGAIAKLVCGTHEHVYRDKFWKGQCGTKATKAFGTDDVGQYVEKAIDLGNPNFIALACKPPLEQLRGTLKMVAEKKCGILGTPATATQSKAIAEEAVLMKEKLVQTPLKDSPIAKSVYDAIKKLNNKKITENMAINTANMIANVPTGVKPLSKVKTAMSFFGDLTAAEKESAEAAIRAALQTPVSGAGPQVGKTPSLPLAPAGLENTPVANAVYKAIADLKNDKITEKMAVKAANTASDRPGGLFGKASGALIELKLSGPENDKANEAIKAALRASGVK